MTTVTEPTRPRPRSTSQETLLDVPLAPLRPSLEAVLMVADQPLDAVALATAVGYPVEEVVAELQLLAEEYDEQGRGFELRNVAGGWRYYTREEYAAVVEGFVLEGQQARLTQAALETLAVVAYKQPVSRARVSAIRGVNVDGVMRTLLTRGLVEEAGAGRVDRRAPLPHDRLLPGADRRAVHRRAARAGAVPSRPGRHGGRARGSGRRRARTRRRPEAGAEHRARWRHRAHVTHACLDDDGLVRLQKLLAQSGVASRRRCEELMLAGLVEVDGEVVTRLGTKVDPRTAVIRVEGQRLPPASPHVYLALNKPRGVVSTMSDPEGRRTLSDVVADRPERLFHVGRLDTDTSGLIILTNDGDFAQRLAHPSYEVDKTYVAEVTGEVTKATLRRLTDGVTLDDGPVTVSQARIVQRGSGRTIVELVIHEGRNRIVRRLLDHVGHPVRRLTRTRIGPVSLGQLSSGELRELTNDELGELLDSDPALTRQLGLRATDQPCERIGLSDRSGRPSSHDAGRLVMPRTIAVEVHGRGPGRPGAVRHLAGGLRRGPRGARGAPGAADDVADLGAPHRRADRGGMGRRAGAGPAVVHGLRAACGSRGDPP